MSALARVNVGLSATWTFYEDDWREGDVRIMGPRTHAAWLGSMVFDGARAFEGVMPDLDRHCARVNRSAQTFFLKPMVTTETWMRLAAEGVKRFAPGAALYIRPMYWAESGPAGGIRHDPESTRWCLCIYEAPLPVPPEALTLLEGQGMALLAREELDAYRVVPLHREILEHFFRARGPR